MKQMVNEFTVEEIMIEPANMGGGVTPCTSGCECNMKKDMMKTKDSKTAVMNDVMSDTVKENNMNGVMLDSVKQNNMNMGVMPGSVDLRPNITSGGSMSVQCNTCVMNHVGLAQAYVPYQMELGLKDQETALACGTAFSQLVQPWVRSICP